MLGAITGDIVGSRFEWNNIKRTDFDLFHPACRFTDDTIHTVAVARALLHDRGYVHELKDAYRSYPEAGYGKRFSAWAASDQTAAYNSYGNGSAMRVSPVAWFYPELSSVLAAAEQSAAVTHNHPEGIRGARSVAGAIFKARNGATRDELHTWISDCCGYDLNLSCNQLRPDYTFDVTCQGTIGPAVTAFLESRSFEESVRLAVSLGGDSDTIACITGSISEAFYGSVPATIAEQAWGYLDQELQQVVSDFYRAIGRELPIHNVQG